MSESYASFSALLAHASAGDPLAGELLLSRYRRRLEWMVRVKLDHEFATQVEVSAFVDESLRFAFERLSMFDPDLLPFYVWLRQITGERLARVCKQKEADTDAKTDDGIEVPRGWNDHTVDGSPYEFMADEIRQSQTDDNDPTEWKEMQTRLRAVIAGLDDWHREILVMRFLERMSISEIAAACEISESDAKMRQLRSIQRLNELFDRDVP